MKEKPNNVNIPILPLEQQEVTNEHTQILKTPPYPKRLAIEKVVVHPEFDLEA